MAEQILPVLNRLAYDRTSAVRLELISSCVRILKFRIMYHRTFSREDLELLALLLLLLGDEAEDVCNAANAVRSTDVKAVANTESFVNI
jgi:hypothetical protein